MPTPGLNDIPQINVDMKSMDNIVPWIVAMKLCDWIYQTPLQCSSKEQRHGRQEWAQEPWYAHYTLYDTIKRRGEIFGPKS